jgi:hypothetical protein
VAVHEVEDGEDVLDQIELDDRTPEAQLGLPLRRHVFQAEVYRSVKGADEGHTKTYS